MRHETALKLWSEFTADVPDLACDVAFLQGALQLLFAFADQCTACAAHAVLQCRCLLEESGFMTLLVLRSGPVCAGGGLDHRRRVVCPLDVL